MSDEDLKRTLQDMFPFTKNSHTACIITQSILSVYPVVTEAEIAIRCIKDIKKSLIATQNFSKT